MKIPVDECQAGPDVDVAIAKVLGWQNKGFVHTVTGEPILTPPKEADGVLVDRAGNPVVRKWSTDIAAAWELVKKLQMTLTPNLVHPRARWIADVELKGSHDIWLAGAETAPLAICRAFLKANGVEEIEYETG